MCEEAEDDAGPMTADPELPLVRQFVLDTTDARGWRSSTVSCSACSTGPVTSRRRRANRTRTAGLGAWSAIRDLQFLGTAGGQPSFEMSSLGGVLRAGQRQLERRPGAIDITGPQQHLGAGRVVEVVSLEA